MINRVVNCFFFYVLRLYPEEYREMVYSFLSQCFSPGGVTSQPLPAAADNAEGESKTKSD